MKRIDIIVEKALDAIEDMLTGSAGHEAKLKAADAAFKLKGLYSTDSRAGSAVIGAEEMIRRLLDVIQNQADGSVRRVERAR